MKKQSLFNRDDSNPLSRQKDALLLFFELRDRKYSSIVNELFKFYTFPDIARGINDKYNMLPRAWKDDLEVLQQMGDPSVDWFQPQRTKYLDEMTENYPPVSKIQAFPERPNNSVAEKVVDELIDNERQYFEKLQAFVNAYVVEIEAIASGRVGPSAQEAIALSQQEVNYIFGSSLQKVLHAAESLLTVLDTLVLVPATPRIEGGRPALLAEIIAFAGRSLVNAYGPYNASYQHSKSILERRALDLSNPNMKKKEPMVGQMRCLNFIELWGEISKSKSILKQGTMDLILISPIKRMTNYGLFFGSLKKALQDGDPAKEKVINTLDKINQFSREIDEVVGGGGGMI